MATNGVPSGNEASQWKWKTAGVVAKRSAQATSSRLISAQRHFRDDGERERARAAGGVMANDAGWRFQVCFVVFC